MRYFVYCRKSTESEDRQVLSIGSQQDELERAFAGRPEIEIVEVFKESFSAKAPGRPIFDEMVDRIERGEADGLIAWHPDRLARNSVDGGRIIYLLDRKILKDLKFANFSFENNPQGKLMLSVLLGFSKYYVDALSENVKRGNRAKIARGWRPNFAPFGYLNDPLAKTIIPDPDRFRLVRRLFDMALTGTYSLREIYEESRRLGLRSRQFKRIGGNYLNIAGIHRILKNPFYAGVIMWNGEIHSGAHEPMVTLGELDRIRAAMAHDPKRAPIRREFPFTGLIRCGECGFMITAAEHTNRFGSRYTYYHCTKRRLDYRCRQPSLRAELLDKSIREFLLGLGIDERLKSWWLAKLANTGSSKKADKEKQILAIEHACRETQRALSNLTTLRIREQIPDEEFSRQRQALLAEELRLKQDLVVANQSNSWLEPAEALISFSNRLVFWYEHGGSQVKRRIVKAVGSNPVLKDQILFIEAKKPLDWLKQNDHRLSLRGAFNAVRTLHEKNDPELLEILKLYKELSQGDAGGKLPPGMFSIRTTFSK